MIHEAVFWDVGGVILDIDSIARAQTVFLERAIDTYDLEMSVDAARETWRETMRSHFVDREGTEYRTAREARRKAAHALFDGPPPDDWQTLYQEVTAETVERTPGVQETMAAVAEADLYQAVISDADADLSDRLDAHELGEYLTHVTTSEEVGVVKPDRRVFETAFEKARASGVDPEQGVMIGDKYTNDMEGGTAMGLTTVAFGAEDGPAVDYRIDEIPELLDVLGIRDADRS